MRIAVIGAGAIGAVLAEAARDSGHDVTVCVRTPIRSLVIERGDEVMTLGVEIESDPSALSASSAADVVLVTTKVIDTASAAPWLARLCGPGTLVGVAQNGLDHESRLSAYVPAGRLVPVLAYVAAERLGPGRVRHMAGNTLVVPSDAAATLSETVAAGGLIVRGSFDMRTATWRKLFGNLVGNPITALTMRRISVMQEPGIEDLARGLLLEALAVGRAEGARLDDGDVEAVLSGTGQYGEATGSSMLYDRLAGRPLEHQFLTGEVVRRGRAHDIPVPLNSAMLALLEAIDRQIRSDGSGA